MVGGTVGGDWEGWMFFGFAGGLGNDNEVQKMMCLMAFRGPPQDLIILRSTLECTHVT